jgi:hypothetical protein
MSSMIVACNSSLLSRAPYDRHGFKYLMFNCMMKWLKWSMYHRHMVSYISCISASGIELELSLRESLRAQSIYILDLLRAYPYALKLQSWFATTTSWVHTQKIIGTSKWEGYWSSFTQTNQSNCLEPPSCTTDTWYKVPDGHHVVLLKKDCNEPLTWTSRGVKYATPTDTHPIPTTASRCISASTSPRRWNWEDSRPHKRARTDASVIHGKNKWSI